MRVLFDFFINIARWAWLKEELKRSEMEMNRIIRMRIARRDGLRADSPQEQQGGERGAEIKVSNY